jgi:lactam utilization protein B
LLLAPALQSVGRRSLAIKLLEEEPSAAQQVPQLLTLAKTAGTSSSSGAAASGLDEGHGADDMLGRALHKAVASGDPDLVYLVLFEAYK